MLHQLPPTGADGSGRAGAIATLQAQSLADLQGNERDPLSDPLTSAYCNYRT